MEKNSVHHDAFRYGVVRSQRMLYALVGDMTAATQIVKQASGFHLAARNFDQSKPLLDHAKEEKPFLVILDFEKREVESFRVLNELRQNADFKSIPAVGFVTQAKGQVKSEAEKAGCLRVYFKTEFGKALPDLMTRYAL